LQTQRIVSVEVQKPIVLRVAVQGDPVTLLQGHVVASVERRAHFVIFEFAEPDLQQVGIDM
jgi:formamidopyrimidine-DNA glycosylase